jgi:phosphoglucosamine mutase
LVIRIYYPYDFIQFKAFYVNKSKRIREMARKYFGTDGIRGRANSALMSPDFVIKVGQAAGIKFSSPERPHTVVIGKDTRLSGYMIEHALTAGFTSVGVNVVLLGPMPTPGVAMLTRSMRADFGVMISASHNPYFDNGIKLFMPDGSKLSDELELEIEALIDNATARELSRDMKIGRAKRLEGVYGRYIEYAKRTLLEPLSLEGMRIVIDCANGAAYRVAPEALRELGAEVFTIGVEPSGTNINEKCGSTYPEAVAEKVREVRADIGIALDGDADRVIIVDEKGHVVNGDQLMAVIAKFWKNSGALKGGGIVSTVMANLAFEKYLKTLDLTLERTNVGDRYVVERMRQTGMNLGGEPSGHVIFSDYSTTGDGLVSALQLLSVIVKEGKPVSEICHPFTHYPQIIKNVIFKGGKPLENDGVKKAIKLAEDKLGSEGRLIVRASGTEPVIRVTAEAEDEKIVIDVTESIADAIKRVV